MRVVTNENVWRYFSAFMLSFSCQVVSDSSASPWTVAHQDPLSRGFPGQEYWSGLTFPLPGDPPDSGLEPESPGGQVDSLPLSHVESLFLYL